LKHSVQKKSTPKTLIWTDDEDDFIEYINNYDGRIWDEGDEC